MSTKVKKSKPKRGPKPAKPYPDFPLYAHAAGVWAKTIRSQDFYFGPWSDPDGALDKYLSQKDYLYAGQAAPVDEDPTLHHLANFYLASQLQRRGSGEITPRHYADCERDAKRLLDIVGRHRLVKTLRPCDFAKLRASILEDRKATSAANIIVRIRSIFAWGCRTKLLAHMVDYGGELSRPSATAIRKALACSGSKMFVSADIRTILDWGPHRGLRAMILLAINCGMGNTDCSELEFKHLDLEAGMLDFPRPKTGVPRRAALWRETRAALWRVIRKRKKMEGVPAELDHRVFVTRHREAYVRRNEKGTDLDAITTQFRKLMTACGVFRAGLRFYGLRHTYRTIADETRDFPAIDYTMGHTPGDVAGSPFAIEMAARYRGKIGDDRLRAIAEHVHAWLFGQTPKQAHKKGESV